MVMSASRILTEVRDGVVKLSQKSKLKAVISRVGDRDTINDFKDKIIGALRHFEVRTLIVLLFVLSLMIVKVSSLMELRLVLAEATTGGHVSSAPSERR